MSDGATGRHISRRRLFAAAAAVGAGVLGGCGAAGTPSGGKADPAQVAKRKEPVTVTVWHGSNAITDGGRELLAAFQATQPHVTVDWRAVEWSGAGPMLQRLPIAAASGDLPDTFRGHWSNFGNIIHQNWVRPLDAYMKQAGLAKKDFTPSTWEIASRKGQVYAMPSYAYTLAPMWNKDLLRRNGLNHDHLPLTLDDVLEASGRVLRSASGAAAGGTAGAQGMPGAEAGQQLSTVGWNHRTVTPGHFVFLFGAQVYDGATERVTPDHPGVIEALQWLTQLDRRQGGYARVEQFFSAFSGGGTGAANPFYTGQLAVTNLQPRQFSEVTTQAPQLELGVSQYPTKMGNPADVERTSVQAEVLPISSASKHPDETWALLKFLHVDQATEWGVRTLNTPCLLKAVGPFFERLSAQNFGGDRRLVPYMGVYEAMSRQGTSFWPTMPSTLEYLNAFTAAWNDVIQEKVAPESAMKDLARTQQVELEKALAAK
jgi:multiple sugar transport system substrate-binding protein